MNKSGEKKVSQMKLGFIREKKCSCKGYNLDKLLQPAILILLTKESMHGYKIVQEIAETPMFKGAKPDGTGVYRFLKNMEKRGLLVSSWDLDGVGPAKRFYKITDAGRECLKLWIETLEDYKRSIALLIEMAKATTNSA